MHPFAALMMKNKWNERFAASAYAYGKEPNIFFAEQINELPCGKILIPADGEGRNGVHAASLGWEVQCFDISEEGRKKAILLANEKKTLIHYEIAGFADFESAEESFDCIALIFAHVPPEFRLGWYRRLLKFLKPGGCIILEGYHKDQLGRDSGGPKDVEWLYTEPMLREIFKDLNPIHIEQREVELAEGIYHRGKAMVIRLSGIK